MAIQCPVTETLYFCVGILVLVLAFEQEMSSDGMGWIDVQ